MKQAFRPCKKFHCPGLAMPPQRYCEQHATLEPNRQRETDADRGNAYERGYDRDWQRVRETAMVRDKRTCVWCLLRDRVEEAKEVHHTQSVKKRPDLRLVLENLVSLCKPCHKEATAKELMSL